MSYQSDRYPLVRLLVALDEEGKSHILVYKGVEVYWDGERCTYSGLVPPPSGIPSTLAVFQCRYETAVDYDESGNWDQEAVWRIPTAQEWALIVRGDFQGLKDLWSDIETEDRLESVDPEEIGDL